MAINTANTKKQKSRNEKFVSAFKKDLAATYSRGSYTTTTIGNAAFDGRVRDGNGSDHSFMATKKFEQLLSRKSFKEHPRGIRNFSENYI